MMKWRCTICNWEYNSEKGLPEKNIKPGTSFEQLPENFRCPECGAMKKWFISVEK